jgi:hypothetical protein
MHELEDDISAFEKVTVLGCILLHTMGRLNERTAKATL